MRTLTLSFILALLFLASCGTEVNLYHQGGDYDFSEILGDEGDGDTYEKPDPVDRVEEDQVDEAEDHAEEDSPEESEASEDSMDVIESTEETEASEENELEEAITQEDMEDEVEIDQEMEWEAVEGPYAPLNGELWISLNYSGLNLEDIYLHVLNPEGTEAYYDGRTLDTWFSADDIFLGSSRCFEWDSGAPVLCRHYFPGSTSPQQILAFRAPAEGEYLVAIPRSVAYLTSLSLNFNCGDGWGEFDVAKPDFSLGDVWVGASVKMPECEVTLLGDYDFFIDP